MIHPQKFQLGDLVQVADDLGPSMSHFTAGCRAIVLGSYAEQCLGRADSRKDGDNEIQYSLYLEGHGQCSWYDESQLTLIEANRTDLLTEWKRAAAELDALHGDLEWLFANYGKIKDAVPSASIEALAATVGRSAADLWGPRGEGMTYYLNARALLSHAKPYLETGDLAGWRTAAAKLRP